MGKKSKSSTALVLAGGGARGAYEAGVIDYVVNNITPGGEGNGGFDIFAGTSVGALNCCYLASMADDPVQGIENLVDYWRTIAMEKVLRFGVRELRRMPNLLMGRGWEKEHLHLPVTRPPQAPHPPVKGIFDTSPLREQMRGVIPLFRIEENIRSRALRGVAFCATEVCTGKSIVFYDSSNKKDLTVGNDPAKEARKVGIRLEHVMASAAIPFLFPAVQIDGVCYLDGALHQNTPIKPAIWLGADKVMVISLLPKPETTYQEARMGCRRNPFPGAMFLLGRVANVLMLQALDYEISRIEMFNKLIDHGQRAYGDGFLRNMNRVTRDYRSKTFRPIRTVHIRPSRNLNDLAVEALREAPEELTMPGLPWKAVQRFLKSGYFLESEFLSYLMFTPTYARKLLDLGYKDGRDQDAKLRAFFAP